MLGRSLRKLISAVLMMVGALLVSGLVDMTPMIGSPQIDYPGFNPYLPFWPQLALNWVAIGGGATLLVALGMLAWSDEPVPTLSLARTAVVPVSWFAVISGLKLAGFLAWGTMGPLNVQQPIFRFALTNGLISAALITLAWLAARRAIQSAKNIGPWLRGAWMLVGTSATFSLAILALALGTGLPLQPLAADWWPLIAIIGPAAGLLAFFTWRSNTPIP
ncbi:hypothetical protein D8I30_02165 [Brevundimonas naejangsanensis]|uniref:DUF998 domain-containing protein n=1 Tax=Brevundimonas naejangsanensis TaxID=588932 RepID=A0A494RG73_9CAUL|nr:hypothetical protein [Brevundimonas naejangsanensis]AYG94123.1 hypothetical protein D8I30_02165 [Brevundimonas naejangsanensis]